MHVDQQKNTYETGDKTQSVETLLHSHEQQLQKELQTHIQEIKKDSLITQQEKQTLNDILQSYDVQQRPEEYQLLQAIGMEDEDIDHLISLGYTKKDVNKLLHQIYAYQQSLAEYAEEEERKKRLLTALPSLLRNNVTARTSKILDTKDILSYTEQERNTIIDALTHPNDDENKQIQEIRLKKLQDLIMNAALEGKLLEVYEISIDDQGNLIIKTKLWQSIIIPLSQLTTDKTQADVAPNTKWWSFLENLKKNSKVRSNEM